ncbi:hypothetical protein PGTUg99_013525 [Puccinia graminis f. sp. tritici]|uniref:Uncharacterized protein n=1 Tax=Puccinia graminis f. sp. tritici TaxID=56615 RepID=A0A5B0SM45_PUCGR|nr:hypothetical protein PGTUg99_013525 [Puccinia graminis f. sp. tritici]
MITLERIPATPEMMYRYQVTILLSERYSAGRVAEAEDSSLASIHRGADQASIPIGDGRLRAGMLPSQAASYIQFTKACSLSKPLSWCTYGQQYQPHINT